MPIQDNISVLDSKKDVAIGIDLPMTKDYGSAFKLNYTTLDQASANARNLLLTRQGERPMLPNFGCSLYDLLFQNITEDLVNDFKLRVKEQFEYWLPYISINSLEITGFVDTDRLGLSTEVTNPNLPPREKLVIQKTQGNVLYVHMVISLKNNKYDTKTIALELVNNEI